MIKHLHSTMVLLLLSLVVVTTCMADTANLQASIKRLHELLQTHKRQPVVWANSFVQRHVAMHRITQATFGGYIEESLDAYDDLLSASRFQRLVAHYHGRLVAAYRGKLIADLANLLASPALHGLMIENITAAGSRGRAELHALYPDGPVVLIADLTLSGKTWKIAALEIVGRSVAAHYRGLYANLITANYSLPVLEAEMAEREFVVLDDFSATWDGNRPMDWGAWKEKDRAKPMLYHIEQNGTQYYMTARDSSHSVIVGKFVQWNPRQYPIMSWCWRANSLPVGGNEFLDDANDSAAGIYVFSRKTSLASPNSLNTFGARRCPRARWEDATRFLGLGST